MLAVEEARVLAGRGPAPASSGKLEAPWFQRLAKGQNQNGVDNASERLLFSLEFTQLEEEGA